MGSSGSKASSSSSSSRSTLRSRSFRVFRSSSLGSHHIPNDHQVCDHQKIGTGNNAPCRNQTGIESDQVKIDYYEKVKAEQSDGLPCISSNVELNVWGCASITDPAPRTGSSSARASSNQSWNSSNRFLSHFRLSRANSLGSSRAYPVPSTSLAILNGEEELHLHARSESELVNRREARGADLLPAHLTDRTSLQSYEDTSGNSQLNRAASDFSEDMQDGQTVSSIHERVRDGDSTRMGINANLHSPRIPAEIESSETRFSDRRSINREPAERNVRFSRTLSVGRLRDRVLRRSSLSDLSFFPVREREVRDASSGSRRQTLGSETTTAALEGHAVISAPTSGHPPSNMSSSLFNIQDSRPREARYHDLLEHRSNFIERRSRIRSQVRALQRLGSRFEDLSGHERSCVLSGQHRSGRCTCHLTNRIGNSNEDTSARASISRIVMLAEALFEVLDEIHQQSVVLSSRPSESSLGSVPAPNEVVESLPVKIYTKSKSHRDEEAAQCYICLVEYEEGDSMRTLPCRHEFHRACIDKWLKDVHRVCPLCRGDICCSDIVPAEN